MLLRGFPTDGTPSLSYLNAPSGGIVGYSPGGPGRPGDDGASAYKIAVDNGFSGTEAEWLASLVGSPGAPGSTIEGVEGLQAALDDKLDQAQVDARVAVGTAAFVDSAPETLNTLNELAQALGDDPNFATTVAAQIGQKVDSSDPRLSDERTPGDGTVTLDKLSATGTKDDSTFLRGDGTWSGLPENLVTGFANGTPFGWKFNVLTEAQYEDIETPDTGTVYVRLDTGA